MGWAYGKDSKGRDIGYAVEAKCDHPGCDVDIDRGLAFKCGGIIGSDGCCEGFFCAKHRTYHSHAGSNQEGAEVCPACYAEIDKTYPEDE